jgi:hypothetical protein
MIDLNLTSIPAFLVQLPRWLMWAEAERNGKKTKVPLTAAGRNAKSTDPSTWCDYNTAAGVLRLRLANFAGIGIALGLDAATGETLSGIDFDSCLDADGRLADWAAPIVALLLGTYGEISPSGFGMKFFFRASVADINQLRTAFGITPTKFGTKKSVLAASNGQEHGPAIEVYLGHGRYFAVTGNRWAEAAADVALLDLATLLAIAGLVRAATGTTSTKGKGKTTSTKKTAGRDRTRSAAAFRLGMQLFRDGKSYDEMVAALRADPETAEWVVEKGDLDNGRELLRIWEAAEERARGRHKVIQIVESELDRLADEAEMAMIAAGADVFQRGPVLCRPAITQLPAADGGTTWAATLHELTPPGLLDQFCATAQWVRWNEKAGWVAANPPPVVAAILHTRVGNWNVPPCRGVLMCPTLRPDGSLLNTKGFDQETCYFLWLPPDLDGLRIPDRPTRAEAEAALQLLETLLGEFPFKDPASKSIALSALITPVVRAAMPVCPIHVSSSPVAGSGKSFLFDVSSAIATGNRCPVIFAGSDRNELEKKANGMLLAGVSVFSIDNLDQPLEGDLLCQACERPLLSLRRLGKSDPILGLNGSTIFACGNNLPVHSDLARRVLECLLDRGVERPELHKFNSNPMQTVLANRGRYVSAVLTVVRGYLVADDAPEPSPLASYEAYSKFVRGPLVWLGRADPIGGLVGERHTDPIRNELVAFMQGWEENFGLNHAYSAAAIARNISTDGLPRLDPSASAAAFDAWSIEKDRWKEFAPIVHATCGTHGRASSRDIGNWFRKHQDRVIDGRAFVGRGGHGKITLWALVIPKATTP